MYCEQLYISLESSELLATEWQCQIEASCPKKLSFLKALQSYQAKQLVNLQMQKVLII